MTRVAVAICAIIKNESRHILEWIAYHRVIGIRSFFLYDNGSTDATRSLLEPLARSGFITLIDWPHNPGQLQAYSHHIEHRRHASEWTAFIDADEYLHVLTGETVADWLRRRVGDRSAALQWLNFGPSGLIEVPRALEIAAFDLRLPGLSAVNGHVKTIMRNEDFVAPITPHAFQSKRPVVDERAVPVVPVNGDYSIQQPLVHPEICLNHYYTRSRAEWMEKVARGMADSASDAPNRRDIAWFDDYVREATVPDTRIGVWAARTSAELARLRSIA